MKNNLKFVLKNNGNIIEYKIPNTNHKVTKEEKKANSIIAFLINSKLQKSIIDFGEYINNNINNISEETLDLYIRNFIGNSMESILKRNERRHVLNNSCDAKKLAEINEIIASQDNNLFNKYLLKRVLTYYYNDILFGKTKEEIENLKIKKLGNSDYTSDVINNRKPIDDNISEILDNSIGNAIDNNYEQKIKTKCFDCQNASGLRCTKFSDDYIKHIGHYPYITKGYMIQKNGELQNFVVQECDNFKKDSREAANNRLQAYLKRRKCLEMISEIVFDTETVQEAQDVYNYQKKKGFIK